MRCTYGLYCSKLTIAVVPLILLLSIAPVSATAEQPTGSDREVEPASANEFVPLLFAWPPTIPAYYDGASSGVSGGQFDFYTRFDNVRPPSEPANITVHQQFQTASVAEGLAYYYEVGNIPGVLNVGSPAYSPGVCDFGPSNREHVSQGGATWRTRIFFGDPELGILIPPGQTACADLNFELNFTSFHWNILQTPTGGTVTFRGGRWLVGYSQDVYNTDSDVRATVN